MLAVHQALHAVTGRIYDSVSLAGDTTPARTFQGLFVVVSGDDVMLQWTDAAVFESLRVAIGFVAMNIEELERCIEMPEASMHRPQAVREIGSLIRHGAVFAPDNVSRRVFPQLGDV